MEIPNLTLSTIWSLDNKVSVVNQVEVSMITQFRNNVEVSLNVKSKLLVELTLGWLIWVLISIDNLPSLVNFSMLLVNNDIPVFSVNASLNIKDLTFFVGDEGTIFFPQLPPS
jgi:hypothetical protein